MSLSQSRRSTRCAIPSACRLRVIIIGAATAGVSLHRPTLRGARERAPRSRHFLKGRLSPREREGAAGEAKITFGLTRAALADLSGTLRGKVRGGA